MCSLYALSFVQSWKYSIQEVFNLLFDGHSGSQNQPFVCHYDFGITNNKLKKKIYYQSASVIF